jgi:inhibitor of cysteine peptidase
LSEWTFNETDNGREVTVASGDIITIELPDNQTTGYEWVATASTDDVLTLTERRFRPPASTAPGTAGRRRLVYRVRAAGSTAIALARRRPWEPAAQSSSEFRLVVHAN